MTVENEVKKIWYASMSGIKKSTNVRYPSEVRNETVDKCGRWRELKRKRTSPCQQGTHTDHYPNSQESRQGEGALLSRSWSKWGNTYLWKSQANKICSPFSFPPSFSLLIQGGLQPVMFDNGPTLAHKGLFQWFGQVGQYGSDALDQLCHIWQRTCPTFAQRGHFWWQWSGTVTHFGQLVPGQSPNQATMPD